MPPWCSGRSSPPRRPRNSGIRTSGVSRSARARTNAGVIRFRVTPKGGTAIDIPVALEDGRGEDGAARDIRDTLKKALDKDLFKIELDDGEDVLVKVREGPVIAIELVESTVKGTRVNLDPE